LVALLNANPEMRLICCYPDRLPPNMARRSKYKMFNGQFAVRLVYDPEDRGVKRYFYLKSREEEFDSHLRERGVKNVLKLPNKPAEDAITDEEIRNSFTPKSQPQAKS
jgi:hypothetical protein